MFYAWEKVRGVFIFTSEMHTLHSAQALANPAAAASILLETRTVGRLQGLQLRGRAAPVEEGMLGEARRAYIRRFPYAAAADLSLWEFAPEWMKLTDNTLGFGKKIIWMKDE